MCAPAVLTHAAQFTDTLGVRQEEAQNRKSLHCRLGDMDKERGSTQLLNRRTCPAGGREGPIGVSNSGLEGETTDHKKDPPIAGQIRSVQYFSAM